MEEKILYVAKYSHDIVGMSNLRKIGKTNNIEGRMNKLTIGVVEVTPIATYVAESSIIDLFEKNLLQTFEQYRVKGEWFEDKDNMIVGFIDFQIKKLKKHGVTIKKLPLKNKK